MAMIAAANGITRIVATPHVTELREEDLVRFADGIKNLKACLEERAIPVELLGGAEVSAFLDPARLKDYTINKTRYILIEFPRTHTPKKANEIVFNFVVAGYRPIIVHPERNSSVIRDPGILFDMVDSGGLVQITADSLTGRFGPNEQACAAYILRKGLVSFMSSDAHSANGRPPVLSKGLEMASSIIGKKRALALVTVNPEAVIRGKQL
jgi:protein-tyrosine phosphatase